MKMGAGSRHRPETIAKIKATKAAKAGHVPGSAWNAVRAVALWKLGCSMKDIARDAGLTVGEADWRLSGAVLHNHGIEHATVERRCLRCRDQFESQGAHHRLCYPCSQFAERNDESVHAPAGVRMREGPL